MSGHLFWLSEEQFARSKPLLPNKVRGVPRVDDQCVISAIVHVLKSGCRWVDAPSDYGPQKTLDNRFVRWAEKGGENARHRAFTRWPNVEDPRNYRPVLSSDPFYTDGRSCA